MDFLSKVKSDLSRCAIGTDISVRHLTMQRAKEVNTTDERRTEKKSRQKQDHAFYFVRFFLRLCFFIRAEFRCGRRCRYDILAVCIGPELVIYPNITRNHVKHWPYERCVRARRPDDQPVHTTVREEQEEEEEEEAETGTYKTAVQNHQNADNNFHSIRFNDKMCQGTHDCMPTENRNRKTAIGNTSFVVEKLNFFAIWFSFSFTFAHCFDWIGIYGRARRVRCGEFVPAPCAPSSVCFVNGLSKFRERNLRSNVRQIYTRTKPSGNSNKSSNQPLPLSLLSILSSSIIFVWIRSVRKTSHVLPGLCVHSMRRIVAIITAICTIVFISISLRLWSSAGQTGRDTAQWPSATVLRWHLSHRLSARRFCLRCQVT